MQDLEQELGLSASDAKKYEELHQQSGNEEDVEGSGEKTHDVETSPASISPQVMAADEVGNVYAQFKEEEYAAKALTNLTR
ncbi:hypothetical protein Tco_0031030 [Tanacetum coccineum]